MMRRKIVLLRWLIVGFAVALSLLPTVALASDCPPEDTSRSDCKAAASTARSPVVPIAGAAAGGIAGAVAGRVLDRGGDAAEEEGEEETSKDPCQADLDRYNEARLTASEMHALSQDLRNLLNVYETQWENTRESSYLSGATDVAFLAGSIFTKPVAGLLGREIISQTLKQKMAEAALKALGKEITKSVFKTLTDQGINPGNFFEKPIRGAQKKLLVESLKEAITFREMRRLAGQGLNPQGPIGKRLLEIAKRDVAGPLGDYFSNMLSVASMAEGAIAGKEKLEAIRSNMHQVRTQLLDVEHRFADAMEDARSAQRVLEHCRKIWAQ